MSPETATQATGRSTDIAALANELRAMSVRLLQRMFDAASGRFVHCLRRHPDGIRPEGHSLRYTATVLIAFARETDALVASVLGDRSPQSITADLIERVQIRPDLGETALTLWAARVQQHPDVPRAIARLKALAPDTAAFPTVELSWAITALSVGSDSPTDEKLRDALVARLLRSQSSTSHLFSHWPAGAAPSWWRSHVCCFADKVYPIQALSHYYRATNDRGALEAATKCAARMVELQGPQGQWWWHHDVRTGRVVEGYPVYSVHQEAMAPMALFALHDAGGPLHREAVVRSMQWMIHAPEIDGSLVDRENDVIWRKVARHEPNKLVRSLHAVASRIHPAIRWPGTDLIFRPGWIDYESRPYHMGWLLYAWSANRVADFA